MYNKAGFCQDISYELELHAALPFVLAKCSFVLKLTVTSKRTMTAYYNQEGENKVRSNQQSELSQRQ